LHPCAAAGGTAAINPLPSKQVDRFSQRKQASLESG
jgi:hypothetical protein